MKNLLFIFCLFLSFGVTAQTAVRITNSDTLSMAGATDQDGRIVSYSWRQVSGVATTIPTPTSVTTVITFSQAGTYVYEGSVVDNDGLIGKGTYTVNVFAAKIPPEAIIRGSAQVSPGVSNIQLPLIAK